MKQKTIKIRLEKCGFGDFKLTRIVNAASIPVGKRVCGIDGMITEEEVEFVARDRRWECTIEGN